MHENKIWRAAQSKDFWPTNNDNFNNDKDNFNNDNDNFNNDKDNFNNDNDNFNNNNDNFNNNNGKKKPKFTENIVGALTKAKTFIMTGKKPTSIIINSLLGTIINDKDLSNLLNGPKYTFNNLTETSKKKVIITVRKVCKSNNSFSGVYIWTHLPSGKKYVGSSIQLPIRLQSYMRNTKAPIISGKFIPLLKSSPITEFTIEIIFTPYFSNYRSEIILEQYFLLLPEFNLNTIKVSNNPSGSNTKSLYIYNRDGSICYFKSTKQTDFVHKLGISYTTFHKHLENGTYYLNKYIFTREELPNSVQSCFTVEEINTMLNIDRQQYNKNKCVVPFSVPITLINIDTKVEYKFDSLGKTIKFFKNASFPADQRTLVKRINTNIPYNGFTCHK